MAYVDSADLASTDSDKGAALVGTDDGQGGLFWQTIAGFIGYLRNQTGAAVVGTSGGNSVEEELHARYTKTEADAINAIKPVLQNRARIDYNSASSVRIYVPESLVMAGFWWMRSYRKGSGLAFSSGVNGDTIVSFPSNLAFENSVHLSNWYSVFACANPGDSKATYKLVPYFTVASRAGSVLTFGDPGIGANSSATTTYSGLATDALVGVDVLVIDEEEWLIGRTTTATANTNGTLTLADAGTLAQGDRVLVAPPGYQEYVWLCDIYIDSAEPRNIADTGAWVGTTQSNNISSVPTSGEVSPALKIDCRSYVSPLALGIDLFRTFSLQTASTGTVSDNFWHDSSNHVIETRVDTKALTSTQSFATSGISVPFSRQQAFWYATGGSLDTNITLRSMQPRGYYL